MKKLMKAMPLIQLHPVLLFFFLGAYFTGAFLELSILLIIVCIHELGHVVMAVHFNWRIEKILLWVFGGVMKTSEHGSRPIAEEALVTVAGPFQHVLIFLFLTFFGGYLLPESVIAMAHQANMMLLLFNLLPISPLDGGKLVSLILASMLPYRKAHGMTIVLSCLFGLLLLIVQLIYFPFALTAACLAVFLLMENRNEWKQRHYAFIRFLLRRPGKGARRLENTPSAADECLLDVLSRLRRNRKHVFTVDMGQEKQRLSEEEILRHYFSRRSNDRTIGEFVAERN